MRRIDVHPGTFNRLVANQANRDKYMHDLQESQLRYHPSEISEMANMSMIGQFSGDVAKTTLTFGSNRA
jgi:hypothetical protein